MIETILTLIIIPIFVGVVINKLSKDKKEKKHQTIWRSGGGFTFSITIKLKKNK